MSGISKSQVSRLCEEIDGKVKAFLDRPLEGDWPYLWIDATYVKARRRDGRVVSVAVIIAVGVNADGRREVLGMDIGPSEAETFRTSFLRKLTRRGLRGVELVISDAHEGLKAAVAKVLNATWQRCRVHFMRNALAHAGKSGRRVVSAFIATAFAQNDADAARTQWRKVADQLRPTIRRLAEFMDEAETDVLAHMTFPKEHWTKIHSVNPLERLNGEVERRTNVVGIFPNEDAITRLVGAILLEQNDEWAVQRARYLTLETIAPSSDDPTVTLPTLQTDRSGPMPETTVTPSYTTPWDTILGRWQLRLMTELRQLKAHTPAQRLGWYLLRLADASTGAARIKLPYRKSIIAGRIGITPESLSRALARLAEFGVETLGDGGPDPRCAAAGALLPAIADAVRRP